MAVENIRIQYDKIDTSELVKANKQQEKLNDSTEESNKLLGGFSDQLRDSANNVKIFGTGLGDLTTGMISSTKSTFTAVKALKAFKVALISTGIGAIVVALGSLVTFVTKTQRGMDILNKGLAAVGATVDVLIDRFATFGEGLFKVFSGDLAGGVELLTKSFQNLGAEIAKESSAAIALEEANQALIISQRELSVETAKRRADIKELNLIAEDTSRATKERLDAAQATIRIEQELQAARLANAEENLRIIRERNALGESLNADLDAEAEAEIALNNIRLESNELLTTQNNKLNILITQLEKERDARIELLDLSVEKREIEKGIAEEEEEEEAERQEKLLERIGEQIVADTAKRKAETENAKRSADEQLAIEQQLLQQSLGSQSAAALPAILVSSAKAIAGATEAAASIPFPGNLVAIATGVATVAANISSAKSILSSAPKFAEGGMIGGKRHSEGGTLIEAERGEFILNRKAVSRYGQSFLERMNNLDFEDTHAVILDTKPLADEIKKLPEHNLHIDINGFTQHQRRGYDLYKKKLNRYST